MATKQKRRKRKTKKKSKKPKPAKKPIKDRTDDEIIEAVLGRPTLYEPEFCEKLIQHFRGGDIYETFPAKIGVSLSVLYDWEKIHPEFLEAKRRGLPHLLQYDMNLMKAGISGQLRRLVKRKPVMESYETEDPVSKKTVWRKRQVIGADGKPLFNEDFRGATYAQHAHKYRLANVHRWKDRFIVSDSEDPLQGMTEEEAMKMMSDPKFADLAEKVVFKVLGNGTK